MEPIRLREEDGLLCAGVSGRLGEEEAAALAGAVGRRLGGSPVRLLLDLTEVEYMTSSAVGAVVGLYQRVRLDGGRMAVAAPDERVHLLLEIAGLNQLLALCRTAEEARRALAGGEPS